MKNAKSTGEESRSSHHEGSQQNAANVSGQELMDELGHLSTRFVSLAQAAWKSDERKQIEADLRKGLNTVVDSLEEGFQRIRESEQTQESLEKAKDVAESIGERVSTSQTAHELASGLVQGLRMLGERLDKLVDEFGKDAAAEKASAHEEQEIPVQDMSATKKEG